MKNGKGWFKIPGVQDGDRTIDQQMQGLAPLIGEVAGRSVLDLGCAEGLVGMELAEKHEASFVDGLTYVAFEAAVGQALAMSKGLNVTVRRCDLNKLPAWLAEGNPIEDEYDIVLMLAILHKLKRPTDLLDFAVSRKPVLIVIRTAEATPGYVDDARSEHRRVDVVAEMKARGYMLQTQQPGPFTEWTGYFVPV